MQPAGLVTAGAGAGVAGGPLDKVGFKQAIAQLQPNTPNFEAERAKLFERRAAGKRMGME